MKIVREGKKFTVYDNNKELVSFKTFDKARKYLADNGIKDASDKLLDYRDHRLTNKINEGDVIYFPKDTFLD